VNLVDTYTYGQFRGASERINRAKKKEETLLINRMLMEEDNEKQTACMIFYIIHL